MPFGAEERERTPSRMSAVAEQQLSKQPLTPQEHFSPAAMFIIKCPSSTPLPMPPVKSEPFSIIPPPTPVPSVISTLFA